MAETRRVVLATGEVREASVEPAVAYGYMAPLSEVRGHRATRIGEGTVHAPSEAMGDTAEDAVTRLASHNGWAVREILAPGEPTRAELAAQLAAVTAERDALRAEHAADCDLIARQSSILTAVANALKGPPPALSSHSHHDLGAVAAATVAQQAPLVACVDALRAAARDAGWRDADATGEHLVAWVRCDLCGATRTVAAGLDAEGDAVCDGLAHGWRRHGDEDVCEQHSDGGAS